MLLCSLVHTLLLCVHFLNVKKIVPILLALWLLPASHLQNIFECTQSTVRLHLRKMFRSQCVKQKLCCHHFCILKSAVLKTKIILWESHLTLWGIHKIFLINPPVSVLLDVDQVPIWEIQCNEVATIILLSDKKGFQEPFSWQMSRGMTCKKGEWQWKEKNFQKCGTDNFP